MNTVSSSFSESINLSNVIPERRNYISQVTKSVSGRFGNETSWNDHETNRKHQRKMKKNDCNVLNFYVENRIFFFPYKSSFFLFLREVFTTLKDYVTKVNKFTELGLPVKKEKLIKS